MAIDQVNYTEANAAKYANIFKQAYTDLGVQGVPPEQFVQAGRTYIDAMLNGFEPEFKRQTGREPTLDEVNQFLDTNISPGVAATFIQGVPPLGQLRNIGKSYIENNIKPAIEEEALKQSQGTFETQAKQNVETQRGLLDRLAKLEEERAIKASQEQYGESRGRMLKELAASGRAFSPNAYQTVAKSEEAQQKSISDILSQIRASQIGQQLGLEREGQQNVMQNRQFDVGVGQQNKEFGLKRQGLAEQIRQFNEGLYTSQQEARRQRELAERLGRLQADAGKPGTLDYISTGFQGLAGLGGLASGIGALRRK